MTALEMAERAHKSRHMINGYRHILISAGRVKSKLPELVPHDKYYEKIWNAVSEPRNYTDLENLTGIERRLLVLEVNDLRAVGELRWFKLSSRSRSRRIYNCFDLCGDLINEVYVYKPGQECAAAYIILEHTPVEKFISNRGMYHSVISYLNGCLPPDIFEHVQKLYKETYKMLKEAADRKTAALILPRTEPARCRI